MPDYQLSKPVAFMIFNRPECTERVFHEIRRARPPELLVIADGPRPGVPTDHSLCGRTRSIIDGVDWPCVVLTNYSDVNLGCKKRISSGLDWVFASVDEAIILEDDCLPHPTFFRFCEELLDRYKNEHRIMMVSGDNFQFGRQKLEQSYYFSHFNHIWGWAGWRRSWKLYDAAMEKWPVYRDSGRLNERLHDKRTVAYWFRIFNDVYEGKIDTWDYQFMFAAWLHDALIILPAVNLISNIGYGKRSTHTCELDDRYADVPTEEMTFPLVHPSEIMRSAEADRYEQEYWISRTSLRSRIKRLFMRYPALRQCLPDPGNARVLL